MRTDSRTRGPLSQKFRKQLEGKLIPGEETQKRGLGCPDVARKRASDSTRAQRLVQTGARKAEERTGPKRMTGTWLVRTEKERTETLTGLPGSNLGTNILL